MERDVIIQLSKEVEDPETFKEACALFGNEELLTRLRKFHQDLVAHLYWIEREKTEHERLREMAHRTVGHAGIFGFWELMDASARLDDALRLNSNVVNSVELWKQQARRTVDITSRGSLLTR